MSSPSRMVEWTEMLSTQRPALSTPHAPGLALWSVGMVLARSGAVTAVTALLARWWRRQEQTVRQPRREWCDAAEANRGDQRQARDPAVSLVPRRPWIRNQWPGTQLALALDASTWGPRCTVWASSVVSRGGARPVAWTILPANTQQAWRREWWRRLRPRRPAMPRGWTVSVRADRGRYAGWLFRRIVRRGWHPCWRLNAGGTLRPAGSGHCAPLSTVAPHVGSRWRGTGTAFTRAPRQLPGPWLACWPEGDTAPWVILTAWPPAASAAAWDGWRAGIEPGVKVPPRAGGPWPRTRLTEPHRAARRWLAVAVATWWRRRVGGLTDASIPDRTLLDVSGALGMPRRQRRATRRRVVRAVRPGWPLILVARLDQAPWPVGTFLPEPWPTVSWCEHPGMVHDSGVRHDVAA